MEIMFSSFKIGATVELLLVDVNKRKLARDALIQFDEQYPVDILIANAGVSMGNSLEELGINIV